MVFSCAGLRGENLPATAKERTPAAVQAGSLVVNAVPWGQVTAIVDAQGRAQKLPAGAVTPFVITLPPGRYTITVTNPDVAAPVSVTAEVTAGGAVRVLAQLRKVDPDELLKGLGW